MRFLVFVLFFLASALGHAEDLQERFGLRFEISPVWQSVNRIQIHTPEGTRYDFTSLGSGPAWNYRIDAKWRVGKNSEIRALYAPLLSL